MALTKAELINAIQTEFQWSKKEASDFLELVFNVLKEQLIAGKKVKISGFGNFTVRKKRARIGRNPRTGESIEIRPRKVLTFRPSQVLREEVALSLGKVKK